MSDVLNFTDYAPGADDDGSGGACVLELVRLFATHGFPGRVENGVQFGDLIDFVDFDFIARVTRVNAAALWGLASHPSTPKGLLIHTAPPPGLPGTNLTSLEWTANPEANLRGYEVVLRETTEADWTRKIPVGNVTTVTLDISKDNVQFGLRAVDALGQHSPVAFPTVVN